MGLEIERKFLVGDASWRAGASGISYRQGYVLTGPPVSVRVRVAGDRAFLTVKKDQDVSSRLEYEYEIPVQDARDLLSGCCAGHQVEKTRYLVPHAGHTWEVDVFHGENEGLVVAEIELDAVNESFERPPWLGSEVTGDRRYLNSSLFREPYRTWAAR